MSTFADSSALVKLYADESGYEHIRGIGSIAVSQLARVEVPAALWRKQSIGELSANEARRIGGESAGDAEASQLVADLQALKSVLAGNELAMPVPETQSPATRRK